ncbi:succinylglutamate-semialdehyde dehydrogenase [Sphingomonas morindae]|uniref:Succinylglutamate-semialdehyde dehydrogenase n=1 Tax=Sphingomonas morindae TaxID=1541170 RepID=A0ABY4X884_9SPHN|nr:succinylglutamate-semialdehyde dehydrogenase [Sphingomonas morindae]USI73119.1 succinylglutamate-semialdehyde dehydrogenase [Sphingomonas morindae]
MSAAAASASLVSIEPATGARLWEGPVGDVDAAVAAARAGWAEWARRPVSERIATLERFAATVRARGEAFADLLARETGKPLWEARTEIEAVANKVAISIKAQEERAGSRDLDATAAGRTALRHKPHGVLAVLGPFNFPAHLPNGHIVPALLAGNAIVFKPSEKTPATGAMLVDCYHEAGVPASVIALVPGGPDIGRALAGHGGIDGLLFTGSARAGAALHRQFADMPHKILALELGGNNPLMVWDCGDPEAAAALCVQSAYLSAGQRCTAARRLIVRDGAEAPLVQAILALIDRLIVDHPHADPAPFLGPVIDNDAADGVEGAFLDLVAAGGRVLAPLDRPEAGRPFLRPALIDVTDIAARADEEIFGPVLQIVRVPDFEAGLREAAATRFGLSAALIADDPALFDRFWAASRAGIVNWNRPTNGAPSSAPFGGIGLSGNHRPSAYYAADYCAYPVVSGESARPAGALPTGLRPA